MHKIVLTTSIKVERFTTIRHKKITEILLSALRVCVFKGGGLVKVHTSLNHRT